MKTDERCPYKVMEVYPNGTALVDTAGLYRLVLKGEEILDELCNHREAKVFVETWDDVSKAKGELEMITYEEAYRRSQVDEPAAIAAG